MKLSQRTVQILKNYSVLNPSLVFREGNVLKTMTPNKTVYSKAVVGETIPSTFAIYELSKFLSVLSLFEAPEIELSEKYLVVKGNNQQVQYTYGDIDNIVAPGDKEIKLPDMEINFRLTNTTLQGLFKAMAILGTPEIAVTGESGLMHIETINTKNPLADKFKVQVGTCLDTQKFKMIMLAENLKILPEDYDVSITSKGISHFKGKDIEYWIATESSSTYEQ